MKLVIYGAQGIALGSFIAIKELYPEKLVTCFLVTAMKNNAKVLGGLPVRELTEFVANMTHKEKEETQVLICTPESVMEEIENSLEEVGLQHHIRLGSVKWAKLQEQAFAKLGRFVPLNTYSVRDTEANVLLYKMMHHKDTPLQTKMQDSEMIVPLQVGAALTDKKIANLADNIGDNISKKNGNYSELTGLYWIWKNAMRINNKEAYLGLIHYRRLFELSKEDLYRLVDNEIDVLLPFPMPYEPNIEVHHERYIKEEEWNAVLQALEEIQPEYATAFQKILGQRYLYNYNIIVAKSKVLMDYCEWLFPILFRIEQINDPMGEKEPNRYIGYVGEALETLYFLYNKQNYKIAHVGCRFLQ